MPTRGLVPLLRRTYWISVVAITAVAASVIAVAVAQRDLDRWAQHSREVVRMARSAQLLAAEREAVVRGFLLSGDTTLVAPERTARPRLAALLDSLVAATADNPAQQRRASAFAEALTRWDTAFAQPVIAQRARPGGSTTVTTTFGSGGLAGRLLFDEVRTRFAEFEREEESLYRQRSRTATSLQRVNVIVSVVGLGLLAVILASLRGRLQRQAVALTERQEQLEEQAMELEEQASELEEQAAELESQTSELQDTVAELGRKNEELNAFSASVAHDLRSPLRSIDGFGHLLLSDYADRLDDTGVNAVTRIRTNTQRMGELIDGLLTLARVSSGGLRLADVNLAELATASGDELRRSGNGDPAVELAVQPSIPARGDARLLRVAVHNLVENAFKFSRSRPDARVEVGSAMLEGERTYFVADNGVGFDMRYADKLFGAFERLHHDQPYEGTGIGLATVRRIVERHGGRIWADAKPGRGATFYFTLGR